MRSTCRLKPATRLHSRREPCGKGVQTRENENQPYRGCMTYALQPVERLVRHPAVKRWWRERNGHSWQQVGTLCTPPSPSGYGTALVMRRGNSSGVRVPPAALVQYRVYARADTFIMKTCQGCDTEIPLGRKRFCSPECQVTKKKLAARMDSDLFCTFCKTNKIGLNSKKYCSLTCMMTEKSQKVVDAWLADPDSATRKDGLARPIKMYLIKQAENKCSECGWNEINPFTGKVPLSVDHIDGNCHNNSADNLVVLCPNCHALTTTYKALNRNSRRAVK